MRTGLPLWNPGRPAATPLRRAMPQRWILAGCLLGGLLALGVAAPAAWLASAINQASHGRLLLAETEGTWWRGSALLVLSGGEGSRSAAILPSRLHWRLSAGWRGLQLVARQACCIDGRLTLQWQPGWRQQQFSLSGDGERIGHWPAAWLEGLGAPLNTLRPGGELVLMTQGLGGRLADGRWQFDGQARLELQRFSSRLSLLEPLGSYALALQPQADGQLGLHLSTLDGALQLQGDGRADARGLHFNGTAQAAPGSEAALNNLLNIIGKREGALSRLVIG